MANFIIKDSDLIYQECRLGLGFFFKKAFIHSSRLFSKHLMSSVYHTFSRHLLSSKMYQLAIVTMIRSNNYKILVA